MALEIQTKKIKRRDEKIEEQKILLSEQKEAIQEIGSELDKIKQGCEKKEEVINKLRKDKRSLLVKVCRLSQKHNNRESNIENITLQNDLQITQLKDEIKFKEHQIAELEDINELLLQSEIECYFDGKYNDEIRETIMALVTQFGVSLNKVNGVIQTVVQKITGKTLSRLPSAGVRSRLLVEAKRVAQCQVATAMLDNGLSSELQYGNCLHQDGTSKFHRHFQSFQVTTAEKELFLLV